MPSAFEIAGQHVGREARLLLVEIDGDDVEAERRAPLQRAQDVEQAVAVLAAGEADHHPVARRDQAVVADRFADLAAQPLAELVRLEVGLARIGARAPGAARAAASGAMASVTSSIVALRAADRVREARMVA